MKERENERERENEKEKEKETDSAVPDASPWTAFCLSQKHGVGGD